MPIEGRIRDFKKEGAIPIRLWLCDGTSKTLMTNASLLIGTEHIYVDFQGKVKGTVSYALQDLVEDAYAVLTREETPKPCSKSRAHGSDTAGRNEPNKNQRGENR